MFNYVGKNSILIYCVSEVFRGYFPFRFECPEAHAQLLTMHIISVAYTCLLAYIAAARGVFVKV